jgi:hypothetical protein
MTSAAIGPGLWRREDEALRARLEDELLLEQLFRRHLAVARVAKAAAPPPHPRAAGMITVAARSPAGAKAREAALRGDLDPLASLLESGDLTTFPPELAHHVALYFARLARAVEPFSFEVAVGAHQRAIAAWLTLGAQKRYLAALATEITDASGEEAQAFAGPESGAGVAERFALERLDELGAAAERSAPTLDRSGASALACLAFVAGSAQKAGGSEGFARRASIRAESRRARAIDAALDPVREAVQDTATRDLLPLKRAEALARAAQVWTWSGRDASVEHFVVEQLVPIAWDMYRANDWDALRAALLPFQAMVDSLATRIERAPLDMVAYAATCADVLMFEAESQTTLERQMQVGERLLRVCPSHRNGRLVMAAYLCDKATRMVDTPFVGSDVAAAAEALVDRAEKMYPASKSLDAAKKALERAKSRSPHAFWRRS